MEKSDRNRIWRFFENQSIEDEDFVTDSFYQQENEDELKDIATHQWENTPIKSINLQHVLNRIHFNINSSTNGESRIRKITQIYSRIAAILLLPLIIGSFLFWNTNQSTQNTYTQLTAPKGSRVQFILPDGSSGHLNGGSTIRYASNFKFNRQLELNGEAYFKVEKDKTHQFIVQTQHADIKVFGTSFDVCAYESEELVTTTLETGSVEVFNKINFSAIKLSPGQQNQLDTSTGEMKNTRVKTQLYTSWKDDLLRFDNAPFAEVVKKMERWYGVHIILDKSLQYSENYTMTIKTESLREMLQLLQITTPMNYIIENDIVKIKNPTNQKMK